MFAIHPAVRRTHQQLVSGIVKILEQIRLGVKVSEYLGTAPDKYFSLFANKT